MKQQSRKRSEVPREFAPGSNQEPSLSMKSMNPAEGETLGTFDVRTDLDAFLVFVFRACSRIFKWSETEKVFYLINALTERAEPIVKEVGSDGTLEDIMKLLQSRFGNRCKQEKFRNELKNRRRGPDESLQDFYLDICRLRTNAYDNDPNEKFPEIFFRNIFVDALGDRELRRAILIQEPVTMEAAYNVAMKLEAIDAYQTPFRDGTRDKKKVRKLDQEFVDPVEFLKVTETRTQVVGNQRVAELEELVRTQNAVISGMRQINESLKYESSQTISRPMQNPGSEESSDQSYGGGTVNDYRESSVSVNKRRSLIEELGLANDDVIIVMHTDTSIDIVKSHEDEMNIQRVRETMVPDPRRIEQEGVDPFLEPRKTISRRIKYDEKHI